GSDSVPAPPNSPVVACFAVLEPLTLAVRPARAQVIAASIDTSPPPTTSLDGTSMVRRPRPDPIAQLSRLGKSMNASPYEPEMRVAPPPVTVPPASVPAQSAEPGSVS